ncbi:FKBP-type peptidyl-prolyl cis-trans isomerase [Hymenobacter sp. NST-14]|uniref:FKBP-type peptidyl-prolyl cis-trans isomerase n=1 Tax=Hymenobacter piscis TaxID=2839984 RepID=UPI001C0267D3|nr:FKBP-type peptidyl-prolyl cis-trans isomerase [Hymenobacter piscis]MBT9393513.1 FKBP-type peptidyl-prolyl cis-trans isomerase [Hymenobacter piscis]
MFRSVSLFRRSAGLTTLLLTLATLLFSACQKEDVDNTDYAARDEALITAYIQDNNLSGFQRQESGLYVAITQPGTGATAQAGQTVSARYTGLTLDGKVFDSTANRNNTPLDFTLGRGQVIAGWDQGFALLNKGSKAILLIPSDLAYGSQGVGPIAPRSVLRFDVEVTDIK